MVHFQSDGFLNALAANCAFEIVSLENHISQASGQFDPFLIHPFFGGL